MRDTITQLKAYATDATRMAKRLDADGEWHGYGHAKHFAPMPLEVDNLADIYRALEFILNDPHVCIIRGVKRATVTPEATPDLFDPKSAHRVKRVLRAFRDEPHHWVCMDVDHFEPKNHDPIADTEGAVREAIEALLPEEFHDADVVWQLSNSAGYKPGLRVHLWFWLSDKWRSVDLKQWAIDAGVNVDKALFNPVQAHYTAAPVIENGDHRVTQRMGYIERARREVDLRIDPDVLEYTNQLADGQDDSMAMPDPCEKANYIGAFCRAHSIEDVIENIIPGVFEPQGNGDGRRLTYLLADGGAVGGAFITADGKHIVNKHNSDPFYNRAANAFDLVRHFRFDGDSDDTEKDTHKRTSYHAMMAYCAEDEDVAKETARIPGFADVFDAASAFDDDMLEEDDGLDDLLGPAEDDDGLDDLLGDITSKMDEVIAQHEAEQKSRAQQFMSDIRSTETHKGASAYSIWAKEKVDPDDSMGFELTKDGARKATLHNVLMVFAVDPILRRALGYDLFRHTGAAYGPLPWRGRGDKTGRGQFTRENPGQWTENDDARFKVYVEDVYGFMPQAQHITDAVTIVTNWAQFHPVQSAIEAHTWDGTPRLDTWLHDVFGVEDNPYSRAVGARTLIGAVKRIYDPGAKHDTILIVEGEQGIGKSTAFEALCLNEAWFKDGISQLDEPKKVMEETAGSWIVELPELKALTKLRDPEAAKEVVTRRSDTSRLAYAREAVSRPRQFIFVGTSNRDDYLIDPSGNRRYWSVYAKTEAVDFDAVRAAAPQIWAEARYRALELGERNWIGADEPELLQAARNEQEARYEPGSHEEAIIEWLNSPVDLDFEDPNFVADNSTALTEWQGHYYRTAVTLNDVVEGALRLPFSAPPQARNAARNAAKRVFRRSAEWSDKAEQKWIDGKNTRRYLRLSLDSINP